MMGMQSVHCYFFFLSRDGFVCILDSSYRIHVVGGIFVLIRKFEHMTQILSVKHLQIIVPTVVTITVGLWVRPAE